MSSSSGCFPQVYISSGASILFKGFFLHIVKVLFPSPVFSILRLFDLFLLVFRRANL